jgi:GTP pyrophosphokinase
VDLEWSQEDSAEFRTGLRIIAVDKPGILAEATKVISALGGNISNVQVSISRDKKASILIEVTVKNMPQLHSLLTSLEKIDGIISAERYRLSLTH